MKRLTDFQFLFYPQNALLNDVNRRDIENLIKGDNNESLMDDVIAAASSTTATTTTTSQINQEDPMGVTSCLKTMNTSANDTLPSQSSISATSVLEMSKTEAGILNTKLSMKEKSAHQANTPTSGTTIGK